jgi:hypothetical protein
MAMKPAKIILQGKLKKDIELLTKQKLSNSDAWEAVHNLSGVFRVLEKMKKEAKYEAI